MDDSIKEDNHRDSYFIDPFLIDPPKVFDSIFVPSSEPESSSIEPAPKNQMTSKAYSRKKVAIPRLIQVQESKSASRNEVTVSHPPLQTELEL